MANYLKSGQMSHKAFQQQIIDLARLSGFEKIYFTWNSRHSPAGYPDLVMLKTLLGGVTIGIVVELKVGKDKLSTAQTGWLEILSMVNGLFPFVWKPESFEEIVEVLQLNGLPDIIRVWKNHALYANSHFGLDLVTQGKE